MGNKQAVLWILAAVLAFSATAKRQRLFGWRLGGAKIQETSPVESLLPLQANVVGEGYFKQELDHFVNTTTQWDQHYYFNYAYAGNYAKRDRQVAFLMIGGEGPEGPHWSRDERIPYIQWAKSFNAAVFDVEHRFYGHSRPFPEQTTDNLKYLSSRQAIEDLAYFIKYINRQNQWTNAKWVVFGGSYSGAMALWFRQAYPELAIGAVGSSGPIQAQFDFYKYLQVVENSLAYNGSTIAPDLTLGSPQCVADVKEGFQKLITLMQTKEGRDTLTKTFRVQPGLNDLKLTYNDIQNFYSLIFGNFQGAVQYSNDNAGQYATGYGIKDACTIMGKAGDKLQGLADVDLFMNGGFPNNYTLFNNYTADIAMLQYTKYDEGDGLDLAAARSWIWQTCNEFGFYQTTDYAESIFGATAPNNIYINTCIDIFGKQFNADYISKAVDSTNAYYGGADGYKGTNVVMPNGDLDPWHALGRYKTDSYEQVYYLISGSAHCGDMYPVAPNDNRYSKIHPLILRHLTNWLTGPPSKLNSNENTNQKEATTSSKRFPTTPKPFVPEITSLGKKLSESKPEFTDLESRYAVLRNRPRTISPEFDLTAADMSGYTAFTFTQPLCHFNNRMPETFQQRFWKNTKFAKAGGPNFFMIGGEGPANPEKWILNENITYLQYAKQYGATVYYMEHRCYGESHDLGNSKNNTDFVMLFCNSWQSLWDIKLFIETINYQTGAAAPWIVFGGSYSGMLSLFAREKFPDLIAGAVGSSAPINMKVDFYEYLEVVERSLRTYDPKCADAVQTGFDSLHQMSLTPDGRVKLSQLFTLAPAWNATTEVKQTDLQFFFNNIYGQFQGAVQYSGDNTNVYANGYGIPDVCKLMSVKDPVAGIVAVNKYMTEMYTKANFTNTANDYWGMIQELRDISEGADRTWIYQTCNEFGFFQSTDLGYGIFGSPTPVNFFLQMCFDIFGQHRDGNMIEGIDYSTASIVQAIQDHYNFFTKPFKATNIVAPNGSNDPWHALGLLMATTDGQTIIPINGTAHCADMYPARAQDQPELTAARTTIGKLIGQWIVNAPTAPPATGTVPAGSDTSTKGASTATVSLLAIALAFLLR